VYQWAVSQTADPGTVWQSKHRFLLHSALADLIAQRQFLCCSHAWPLGVGPWPSTLSALSAFNSGLREKGLTVGVDNGSGVVEYWFRDGVENNDFIKLVSCRKDVIFDQLQFSRPYFIDLVRNGKLIISK
jgi:hypothetical protein